MSKVIVESLVYHLSGRTYESRLVYERGAGAPGPGHGTELDGDWRRCRTHRQSGRKGYVVLLACMGSRCAVQCGRSQRSDDAAQERPRRTSQAHAGGPGVAGAVKALLEPGKVATFGFCFGVAVRWSWRSGADFACGSVVPRHIGHDEPRGCQAHQGSVLVLHGASDPLVPKSSCRHSRTNECGQGRLAVAQLWRGRAFVHRPWRQCAGQDA